MINHTFQVHGDCSEPLQCQICDKKFKTLEGVEKHRLDHRKVFECEPCKRVFTTKIRLYNHNRRFHSAEKDIKLECEICNMKFNARTTYNMHKLRHRYTCLIKHCGQMFQSKNHLELHIAKVHLNDVTVSCKLWLKMLQVQISFPIFLEQNINLRSLQLHNPAQNLFNVSHES